MCKQLALKAHKIMQIREALNIFIVFNCGEKTYFEVLDLQRDNQIFKLLMNIYFEQEMRS